MSPRRTIAVARKELLHIRRDPRSLALALAMPLLLLLLFGYAVTLDVDEIATLIYDVDQSPQSRELISKIEGSRFFRITGYVDNYETVEAAVDTSEVILGVVIPVDYSDKLLAGEQTDVQVLVEGSDSNTASIALGYIQTVIQLHALDVRTAEQERRTGQRIQPVAEPQLRVLYNSELESRNYIVPGLIAVVLQIIGSLLTSLTIAREWEMGTMEQVLSTPLRPTELAVGKMLAYAVISVADVLVALVVGLVVFDVPLRGNPLILAAGCVVFLVGALFWGIMLSAVTRSQLIAYQAALVSSFLPAYLLSGFVFAIETMPGPIQAFTFIVPARYFITILKGVFLKGIGMDILIWQFLFLTIYALIIFSVTTRTLRQKVA